jgi:hypothetical protein
VPGASSRALSSNLIRTLIGIARSERGEKNLKCLGHWRAGINISSNSLKARIIREEKARRKVTRVNSAARAAAKKRAKLKAFPARFFLNEKAKTKTWLKSISPLWH